MYILKYFLLLLRSFLNSDHTLEQPHQCEEESDAFAHWFIFCVTWSIAQFLDVLDTDSLGLSLSLSLSLLMIDFPKWWIERGRYSVIRFRVDHGQSASTQAQLATWSTADHGRTVQMQAGRCQATRDVWCRGANHNGTEKENCKTKKKSILIEPSGFYTLEGRNALWNRCCLVAAAEDVDGANGDEGICGVAV